MVLNKGLILNNMGNCPIHINSELEVVLVKSGSVRVSLGNSSFALGQNQMTVIPPYRLHGFEVLEDADAIVYLFPHAMASDFFSLCRNKEMTNHIFSPDAPTLEYIKSATQRLSEKQSIFLEKSILYTFLAGFTKDNSFTEMNFDTSNANRIIEYIYTNINGDITAKTVADEFAVTEPQLNEMFSAYIGLGFKDFINHMRINNAMELLRDKKFNITEIAYQSGFETLRTFNRIFLRVAGCTPSEYRKQLKK